jgi:uncharacterized glyoxalase superfamily protein PhnB
LEVRHSEITMTAPKPSVCPYLYYSDVKSAATWLQRAFGFALSSAIESPDGTVFHAELTLGDGVVYLGPAMPQFGTLSAGNADSLSSTVHLRVDDLDAHHATAVASGARIDAPPMLMPHGARLYVARDPEGQRWIVSDRG